MNPNLANKLENLTNTSGCYIFKDINDDVIYVGKAKNLFKRVNSYFKSNNTYKNIQLLHNINNVDIFNTKNEKEALLLESNLIKHYHPRYNVLLNDDKQYPYIVITKSQDPKIKISRQKSKNFLYQFGPYPDGSKAYEILKILQRIFPLKRCNATLLKKPCLYYYIDQCLGGCFKKISLAEYNENIYKIKNFLNGKTDFIVDFIKSKMLEYAHNLQFENANKMKKILQKIDLLLQKQVIEISRVQNSDYVNFFIYNTYIIIGIFFYRNGHLLSFDYKIIELFHNNISIIIEDFLIQIYKKNILPKRIIIENTFTLKNIRSLDPKLKITISTKKEDKEVMKSLKSRLEKQINLNFNSQNIVIGKELILLKKLAELIKLPEIPYVLEMYDIANIQNKYPVGGIVVYKNGLPIFNEFRHYNLSESNKSDYSRMQELAEKRVASFKKSQNNYPNLIIVDGNIIQINAIKNIFIKYNLNIAIIGLVKDKNHNTNHIVNNQNKSFHINDAELFNYLSLIQDKVHNFAISWYRKKHQKGLLNIE